MASLELPFERGTTWDSGTYGSPPAHLIGSRYTLNDGTVLQVCRNVDAAALSGGRAVRNNSSAGSALVNEASGAADVRVHGVTDYAYQSDGVTIPVNALHYVQIGGVARVLFGNSVAAGQQVATHGTDGTVASVATISAAAAAVVGVTLAAVNSGSYGYVKMRGLL